MALLDKDVILAWLKISPRKMVVATLCGVIAFLGWTIKDEVHRLVHIFVDRFQQVSESGSYGLPTTLKKPVVTNIEADVKQFMSSHENIGAVVFYEFVPKGSDILYQGRVAVTCVSQSGKNLIDRYNISWLPMNVERLLLEKILRGDSHIRPAIITNELANDTEPSKFNYRLISQDGYKAIVSVPIIDSSQQVRGYIDVFLNTKPVNVQEQITQVKEYNKLAIDLSQYF